MLGAFAAESTHLMEKQRLQWLDALRGFTMLMVVTNHVYGIGFATNTKYSMFMSLCLLFRMPLFFFISGFLAYKASFSWSVRDTGALVLKKLRVQIIPTVVFMTAQIALFAKVFWDRMAESWQSPTKGGYWSTMVLLEMFLIYYLVCWTISLLPSREGSGVRPASASSPSLREGLGVGLLWLLAVFAYATMYMPRSFTWPKEYFWRVTSITELARDFQFFLLGNLVHRYWRQVQRLFDTTWFVPLIIVVAFLGAGDYLKWHNLRMEWANLPRTLAMYALVLLTVAFFRRYAEWFSNERRVGRVLQYVGVRTLDVYLIHFFFIPKLPEVGVWLKAHPQNFIIEGTSAFLVAYLVVAFSLFTSQVLRVSPFLKKWLFGRG